MEIIAPTSFSVAALGTKLSSLNWAAVFVVKASFAISTDGSVDMLEEADTLSGDVFVDDDPDSSCLYESDFAPYKPKTDLIFSGKCYAPGSEPVKVCQAEFRVGGCGKSLFVFGDRYWHRSPAGGWSMSEPEPFTEMELIWSNSFGGPGLKDNPQGKGACQIDMAGGIKIWPLPNIEDPSCLIRSVKDRPPPVGFGPLGRTWPMRMSGKIGTYDQEWLENRWPWFPADFDWSYFNCASPDMQVEGYLKGDEQVYLKNLHPEHPEFRFELPGVRPRLFTYEKLDGDELAFSEVPLVLDTLWVQMEKERVHLVWRGRRPAIDEKLEELQCCFVQCEKLTETPQPLEYYRDLFFRQRQQEEEALPLEPEPELPAMDDSWVKELEESFLQMEKRFKELDAQMDKAEKQALALLKEAGIDTAKLKEAEKAASKLSMKDALLKAAKAQEKMVSEILKDHPELKDKLPPPMSPEEIEELDREMKIDPMPEFEPFPEPLTRQACQERLEKGIALDGEDLSGLDLSRLDFTGASCRGANFEGADLSGVIFKGADLSGAGLSGCCLSGLDLKGADLTEADASGADFSSADMTGAVLDDADLSGCNFKGAILQDVRGVRTLFSGSDLSGAQMQRAVLKEVDLEEVVMDGVDLQGADLTDSSLEGAKGHGINMNGADLTGLQAGGAPDFSGGSFVKIRGADSIWEQALLEGADFSGALLERANFIEARLAGARFLAADLRESRLDGADLNGTFMVSANLFKACFEEAQLKGTDMRMANLYEAEFYNAAIEYVQLQGANLKMTKLAHLETEGPWKS